MEIPKEYPSEKAHALLGASSAHKWLNCTPSAVAESQIEDEGSEYAREGTLAHAMAALELKKWRGLDYSAEHDEIESLRGYHTAEMDESVASYVEYVKSRFSEAIRNTPDAQLMIEARLDYSHWVPGGFGTGDAVIVAEDTMEIIDLKFGKGVEVDATDNPQMKLYALGALDEFLLFYDIRTVRCTIFQPRIGNCSVWSTSVEELRKWADDIVRPLAAVAFRGLGARKSGQWCRFCKAKGTCGRLAKDTLSMIEIPADTLTPEMLGSGILSQIEVAKIWLKAVEEESLAMAMAGTQIPGYKIVEGRSIRKVSDPVKLGMILEGYGFAKEQIWKEPELKTLTDLDKAIGKKRLAEIAGDLIGKPHGKPTLVPESDKRKAWKAADEFDNIDLKEIKN